MGREWRGAWDRMRDHDYLWWLTVDGLEQMQGNIPAAVCEPLGARVGVIAGPNHGRFGTYVWFKV